MFKVIFITFFCHYAVELVASQQCQLSKSSRSCQPTCEFMHPPCRKSVNPQDLCQCEEGYILLNYKNTTCVPIEECPSKCSSPNLFWNDCGSKCPKTCQKPNPQACTKICEPGCFCEEGLILNEANMECIKPKNCPK
ncbi:serine protease inhibitor swm-1-like [Coccinella septempunctata]|uniref:serine protease inhibitor swm-1-like n=1 Tax=Coccinella septempunctata TaxID=41139 RepID=UPI001D07E996|nr:serine protease inhibitor swm-1-like [Coccinella septempunctata]